MSKKEEVTPTQFINVFVISIPTVDPSSEKVTYKTTFIPEAIRVILPDTVINYQLISPTPVGVVFDSVEISPANDQMSAATISQSGKLVTFSDANTAKATYNITLQFRDTDGIKFKVDPVIGNDPSLNPTAEPMTNSTAEPAIGNDPSL